MQNILRGVSALILGLWPALAAADPADLAPMDDPADAAAVLEEAENGRFTVSFTFREPQTALVFGQAGDGYRAGDWQSETAGVRVERIGRVDALIFERPGTEASFTFTPFTENLPKAYTPFLDFTGDDWGVLTGQFRLLEAESRDAIAAFDGSTGDWQGKALSMDVAFTDDRPVYYGGQRYQEGLIIRPKGDGTYAYIGDARPAEGASFVGFIDRALPPWIAGSFDEDLGTIFRTLSDGWGFELPDKAMILFAFKGLEQDGFSMTGGAFEGLLALEVQGSALKTADDAIRNYLLWFFSHEAAHLYQQVGEVQSFNTDDGWIHEGAANTMSYAVVAKISSDPDAFLLESYQSAWTNCLETLRTGPLDEASKRGQFAGHYACGDFAALVTDAILPRHDLYDFWNLLKQKAGQTEEAMITAELYWQTLEELGAPAQSIEDLKLLVSARMNQPEGFLAGVLERAGLPPRFDAEGDPTGFALRAPHDRGALHAIRR